MLPMLAAAAMAGCASSVWPPSAEQHPAQMKARQARAAQTSMAAYLMGTKPKRTLEVPYRVEGREPRIVLQPTGGAVQEPGPGNEVLTSGPGSNGYVAELTRVPKTQFFTVIKEVPCDRRVYLSVVKPSQIRSNPGYVSGYFRDDQPVFRCEQAFHEQFAQGDEALAGADGVLLDGSTLRIEGDGPFVGQVKVYIRAWAVRFADPTPTDIEARLARPARKPIDVLQLRTVLTWIERHHMTAYADALRQSLPQAGTSRIRYAWNDAETAIAETLTRLGDQGGDAYWLSVLDRSRDDTGQLDPKVPFQGLHGAPVLAAAHALGCGSPTRADEIAAIARRSHEAAVKIGAVRALLTLGRDDLARTVSSELNAGGAALATTRAVEHRTDLFTCHGKGGSGGA